MGSEEEFAFFVPVLQRVQVGVRSDAIALFGVLDDAGLGFRLAIGIQASRFCFCFGHDSDSLTEGFCDLSIDTCLQHLEPASPFEERA